MKKYLLSILLTCSAPVLASPIYISDTYYGGDDHGYGDVIGSAGKYGIAGMNVDRSGDTLTVEILTPFASTGLGTFTNLTNKDLSKIGGVKQGIGFGDLFLSSNGWSPDGGAPDAAPYLGDDNNNGEVWEYGISLANRWDGSSTSSLYQLTGSNNDNAHLAEDYLSGGVFRNGQEVAVDTGSQTTNLLANWTSFATTGSSIIFELDIAGTTLAGADSIGIHWGMTCSNDIIEGAYDVPRVPEPATIVTMLIGLVCLVGVAKRRKTPALNNIA